MNEMLPSTNEALPLAPSAERRHYGAAAIALHWLLALLLLGQIAFGWFLDSVPRNTPTRAYVVNLHKSTGLTVALLILVRIVWRIAHRAPRLPSFMPDWERALARTNHVALYACMVIMPLSGYIASNFSKFGVKLYNTVMLPPWGVNDHRVYGVFNTVHVITSYVFVTLIVIHVAAAIRHATRRDGVVARMLTPD